MLNRNHSIYIVCKIRFHLESAMVALFTLEYLLRMFAHSDSFRMLKKFFLCKLRTIAPHIGLDVDILQNG